MTRPSRTRRRWPLAPAMKHAERAVLAAFLVAIALVAWGGWALWQSMVRHRATADETLRDHASYIAGHYAETYGAEAWYAFRNLFMAAQDAAGVPGTRSAEEWTAAVGRMMYESEKPPVMPRVLLAGDSTGWRATSRGGAVDSVLAGRLTARLADALPKGVSYRGTLVVRGADTTLAAVQPRRDGQGWVGFEVPLYDFRATVLLPAPQRSQAFFERMYDSLPEKRPREVIVPIAVSVTVGDSVPILQFNTPLDGWTMGSRTLVPFNGMLAVTIGPDAIPYLMPGGYPPTPGPRVAAVIALALLLLAGTAYLVWRTLTLARMRHEFTSSVSHELRTPLANIHLYAETLMLERLTDPAARRAALETITRETRRLGDMVENVLASARMARADERLEARPDHLGRLVDEVLDAFKPVLASRGMRVEVERLGEDIAIIDGSAVRRILVNLLDNAIRHGPDGQRLRIVVDHRDDSLLLVVEDEGPGIPRTERERVWLPYARGEDGGTGLGLAVVRNLARLHGGDAVVGELERGARIEVRLAAMAEAT